MVTNDPRYRKASDWIEQTIGKVPTKHGLLPQTISSITLKNVISSFHHSISTLFIWFLHLYYNRITASPVNHHYSIGGGSDSYYEYLLKGYLQQGKPSKETTLRDRYVQAMEGVHTVLFRQGRRSRWGFFGDVVQKRFMPKMQTLTCFAPGMLLLGVHHDCTDEKERDLRTARSVLFTCHMMANSTKSGLPPESATISDTVYMTIDIRSKHYLLRPEIVESFYYLKEVTGDPIAQ